MAKVPFYFCEESVGLSYLLYGEMNSAPNPVPALAQSALGARITGSDECTHLGLMLGVFSGVTQHQISDTARLELQFSGPSYDASASMYYCLVFETHAEQILTLSTDTTSGLKMPRL